MSANDPKRTLGYNIIAGFWRYHRRPIGAAIKMSRSADWASIREAVLRRDNYKCVECGTTSCDGWWSKRRRDRAQHHAPGRAQDSASACAVYATVVARLEVRPSSAIRATCRHSARKRKYDFVTVWDRMLSSDADAFDLDCMSSEHFGRLAWQFKRVSGSSGFKV